MEEQGSVGRDLDFLTAKQQQLLSEIAKQRKVTAPTSKEFMRNVDLSAKGILDTLNILAKFDLIEKNSANEISVIDPVLAYWACRKSPYFRE